MKNIIRYITLSVFVMTALCSCKERYVTYNGAEYVMFADTLAVYPVQKDVEYFSVPVVSTVSKDYDRTFAVEIVDKGSNAIEGKHYSIVSNTITIKAGELRTDVLVRPEYDSMDIHDSLGFELRLVMNEALEMPNIGPGTKVVFRKVCPFVLEDFTGWSVFTSLFLYSYAMDGVYQKLVWTEKHPQKENTVIIKNIYQDGYDVWITFNPNDPMDQHITMVEDQVIGKEKSFFGIAYGDDQILTRESPTNYSYFVAGANYVELHTQMYVKDLGEIYGYVGDFLNVLEWVSDEEAYRLGKIEGMPGYDQNIRKANNNK